MKTLLRVALAGALLLCAGCGRTKPGRVLVLGFDGMDPRVVDLLMSEGKLPNFARLRREGAYAPLLSFEPLLSPVVWTTIATGKTPDKHRIGAFTAVNQKTGEPLPVTSRLRQTKAIWNILSEKERSVGVVGWWATWPAEPVRGAMVSDHFAYHFLFDASKADDPAGKTYPPDLTNRLAPLARRPASLTPEDVAPFIHVSKEELARPFDLDDDLSEFKWALSTAKTYHDIGLELWEKDRLDNLLLYFEGTDSTEHLFGHLFRARPLSGELAEQQKRYGNAVEAMYAYADRILGDFLAKADDKTTVLVLSDHGFELGELPEDPSKLRSMRRVTERFHRPYGILYLWGRRVKRGRRLEAPTVLDVAPTILALNGVPPPKDMPGRVLTEGLDVSDPTRVPTYESGAVAAAAAGPTDARVDKEMLKRLESLGYLHATSPSGDRNVAAVLFTQGKYAEAAALYANLVKEKPDDGGLRASLAGALGAMGRYDDALKQLDEAIRIQPLNPEAYHNRAVIHERRGERSAALTDYRTALRYTPDYAPALEALARLGEGSTSSRPRTPAEVRAVELANEASGAARRGDYASAMKALDEAERIAPTLALVFQYRSNVAYLMGDKKRAAAALRRALQIEPDNLLFRENLKNLESPPAR